MLESLKSEIVRLLRVAGEAVSEGSPFTFVRLGEGRGFSSLLWSVSIGNRSYVVKVTDTVSRVDEIAMMISLHDDQKADFALLFGEQHNRELQVYEWFKNRGVPDIPKFFAGTPCKDGIPGVIIMENFASSEGTLREDEGLSPSTVRSIVDTICSYQAAFHFRSGDPANLIPKDLFFSMASPTYKKCVEKVAEKGWMKEHWKSEMLAWCEVPELKRIQNERAEGDPPVTLAHCDLWANNLILGRRGEQVYLLAIVDWQCATVGNALLDVSSVVGINMNPAERREHENKIIKEYIEMISEKCDYTNVKSTFAIDYEQALILYRRGLRFAAIQLALALGTHCDDEMREKTITERLKAILEDIVE
ncbi:hypothetical protein PRIPAC_82926 [Pristionchus pacificus]|nr:hypothetical protein PRIPAC_82926 [Pristionchus pacificus]